MSRARVAAPRDRIVTRPARHESTGSPTGIDRIPNGPSGARLKRSTSPRAASARTVDAMRICKPLRGGQGTVGVTTSVRTAVKVSSWLPRSQPPSLAAAQSAKLGHVSSDRSGGGSSVDQVTSASVIVCTHDRAPLVARCCPVWRSIPQPRRRSSPRTCRSHVSRWSSTWAR